MILKNWLSNTRIGCFFVVGGMDDFFTIKEDVFDDYKDALEGSWYFWDLTTIFLCLFF
jgi:hypothetical protein